MYVVCQRAFSLEIVLGRGFDSMSMGNVKVLVLLVIFEKRRGLRLLLLA